MDLGWLVIVVGVFGLVALSRCFHHRETLKLLELGGDAETMLRLRERWRSRAGLLHGAKLAIVGLVLIVIGGASNVWLPVAVPKGEIPPLGLATPPMLIFLGFLLAAVGAVHLAAYAIWSRRSVLEGGRLPGNTESGDKQDTRGP
jgi:hypothetical protein